jgi:hypothetical protein
LAIFTLINVKDDIWLLTINLNQGYIMKIKNIKWILSLLLVFISGFTQAETLIATASNLQNCKWVVLYSGGVGGSQTDSLYCYDTASDKTNKVVEKVTFGSSCSLHNVSVGYRVVNTNYCASMEVYKVDMLAPTNVKAAVVGGAIKVTWTNVNNPVAPQTIEVLPFRGVKVSIGGNSTGYTDTSFLKDQYYFYNVRTCLGENCSAWSAASNAVIVYSVVPAYVFLTPQKDGYVLGVALNPVAGTNYVAGDTIAFIANSTAQQFCVEKGYLKYSAYELTDNYGNGHKFYARGAWFSYGGNAFKQLVNIHCSN